MMHLQGTSFIGYRRARRTEAPFHVHNPSTGEILEPPFHRASASEVDEACQLAKSAFPVYRRIAEADRARFLNKIVEALEGAAGPLVERYTQESGLPPERARSELERTCKQLRLFADLICQGGWNGEALEAADPGRKPAPRPSTRTRYIGIGPIAVFGPSNFPLAYDAAGGDTASALAAGCPVVVKGHPGHPGTAEIVAGAVLEAAQATSMPEGVFSLLQDNGHEVGKALVKHPAMKGIGFTGSQRAGRALMDLAAARPEPIPVFAEMSSINPVLLFANRLAKDPKGLAEGLAGSLTLGAGQFCTNPGLVLYSQAEAGEAFVHALKERLSQKAPGVMLNHLTKEAYVDGLRRLDGMAAVETLFMPHAKSGCEALPALFRVRLEDALHTEGLLDEVFGPVTLLVECPSDLQFLELLNAIGGQLTTSFFATREDMTTHLRTLHHLETKAGRLIHNGWPTGVEVCATMVHGGPYPASSDSRFTAVGDRAIQRFLRPVCYQNMEDAVWGLF